MRVLQIHNRYRQGGGEDQVVNAEAKLLASTGYEIAQLQVANPDTALATSKSLLFAPWNTRSARDIRSAIAEFNPDLVHVHNTWFRLSPSVVAEAHRWAPVVMTLHNYRLVCANGQLLRNGRPCQLCVDGSLSNGVIHSCYRDPLSSGIAVATIANGRKRVWGNAVDLFLTLSEFASELFAATGVARERMVLKDNFVADPGQRRRAAESSREILFVGRLSPEKGLSQLLRNRFLLSAAGLELVVLGDGPMRDEVASALGTSYLGPVDSESVAERMLGARALLLPSIIFEGQPRTALEAFAAGLPVMGGKQGAIGELVSAFGETWAFDPHNEWQKAISALASDSLIALGSARARQLWEIRFSPGPAIQNLTSAYERAIEMHHLGHHERHQMAKLPGD